MRYLGMLAAIGLIVAVSGTAEATPILLGDGSMTVTGKPGSGTGSANQVLKWGPINLDTMRDTNNQVALRGWVDLSDAQGSANGLAKYWFDIALVDSKSTARRIQAGFSTNELGGWRGIPAQDWDKVSLSQMSNNVYNAGPEKWYTTEGGTTDDTIPPTYIAPSDRSYYFQMIFTHIGTAAPTYDLYVYAMGRGDNNNEPQWYNLGQMTHVSGDDGFPNYTNISKVLVYMGSTAAAETTDVSTVNWYGLTLGAPITMDVPPPPIPEPVTMAGVMLGIGSVVTYVRKRRTA